jgi:hypothetical protein
LHLLSEQSGILYRRYRRLRIRRLVIYDLGGYGGRPDFEAGIPSDWSEKKLQNDLILHTTRGGLYPGWEMPARIFKSDMLFEWWKVDTPAE